MSIAESVRPQSIANKTILQNLEDINKNLEEALETPNVEELNKYLQDAQLQLVMSFSNSDLQFVEIYCFLAQLEKVMQNILQKKIDVINKEFEEKLAVVQKEIEDVKTREAVELAEKLEAEKKAAIRQKSETEVVDHAEKTEKDDVILADLGFCQRKGRPSCR